jgi:PAT family beta-lactamase induction signal transducer AmpG
MSDRQPATKDATKARGPGWRDVLRGLRQRKVAAMLLLGLSAGLPFMLVGNTMGLWLREGGVELTAIGFLSWVGIMYSMKFLWAPIIDKTDVPVLGRLGHRRGWMLLAQIVVAIGLFSMAIVTPEGGLVAFGALALVAAFGSATQDIVIDAWRIESAENGEELSLLSSAYQLGYRTALLLTDAWILVIAAKIGWVASYELIAGLMGLGMIAVMFARESRKTPAEASVVAIPEDEKKLGVSDAMVSRWLLAAVLGVAGVAYLVVAHNLWKKAWEWNDLVFAVGLPLVVWLLVRRGDAAVAPKEPTWSRPLVRPLLRFFDAAVGPLLMFFRDHGKIALLLLVAISLYRLPDFVLGPMANPFYNDIGIEKSLVGAVRGSIGWVSTTIGILAAGVFALRFGLVSTLMVGAILGPGSNLAFAFLAYAGADAGASSVGLCASDWSMIRDACQHPVFALAMVIDNFCTGFAGVALVGYMSSLTSLGYTATQYALLSSFYAMPGKFLKGLSGAAVDGLSKTYGLIDAYAVFFVGTALLGIPVLLLCWWLVLHNRRMQRASALAVG